MVAFDGETYKGHAWIWNGTDLVDVNPPAVGDDGPADLSAFGFVDGHVVYGNRMGAHGHVWSLYVVWPQDGRTVASVKCDVCDDVFTSDDEIVAVAPYEKEILRYDARLNPTGTVKVTGDYFYEVDPDTYAGAGEPPIPFSALAATRDAVYVLGIARADGEGGPSRVFRIDRQGKVTGTSEVIAGDEAAYLTASALTRDGKSLLVGNGGVVTVLDATTLKTTATLAASDDFHMDIKRFAAADSTRVTAIGPTCAAGSEDCSEEPGLRTATWTGSAWQLDTGEAGVCSGSLGADQLRAVRTGGTSYDASLQLQRIHAGTTQNLTGPLSSYGCVVDVPLTR